MTRNTLREIIETPDMGITLSDGCRLSARVWMPQDASDDPVPAILEFLPYRKRDGTCARDALTHPYFAKRGYACIRVDMRGNGDSEGLMEDEYTAQELSDAVEVIHWLAAQDWCSGTVGMMGISWGGFNSLQVAALAPEPLKAIITLCSTVDRFADDIHYKGGCLLNENLGWGATMWSYSSRPPDPVLRPDDWREMWLERLENEPFLPAVWLRHQRRDDYWKHGSVCENYSAIKAKVLAVGGWGDAYKNAVPQIVQNIPGAKGIVGPWVHKYPHFAVPEPRIGFLQEALRWWDRWLKGVGTGVEDDPDYRAYVMDGVRPQTWYLERPGRWVGQDRDNCNQDAFAGTDGNPEMEMWQLSGEGLIRHDDGGKEAPRTGELISSPQSCGANAGEYCAIWLGPELPGDQRADDAMSGTWTSMPLEEDLDILGAPAVALMIETFSLEGPIAVRLNHVHPDGASTRITYGVLNLANPNGGNAGPNPFRKGPNKHLVSVRLDHVGYTIPAGHRLRVAISNVYWPLIWPAPRKTEFRVVYGNVVLPRPVDTLAVAPFPPPEAETPWATEQLRPENHIRRQETDMVTGEVRLVIEDDFGEVRDLDHGLINGSVAREVWSIHPDDPLSARGACHWTDETERDGIRMRTEATCEMWSDASHFYLGARMEAYENDTLIFEKDFSDSIPRDHM